MMTFRKKLLQSVGAGALLIFAGVAQAAAIPLANPGFDVDDATQGDVFGAAGWNAFGGNAFTCDGVVGVNAGSTCPAPNSPNNSLKSFGTAGAFQSFSATAGDVFTMNGFGLNSSLDPLNANSSILLQIAFFDSAGAPAGTAANGQVAPGFNIFDSIPITGLDTQDVWTGMGVGTAPAPDNTAEVRFIVLSLAGAGGAGFFDDISADQVVVPVPAAVWLFGSGLMGLVGVARRRKKS